MKMTRIRRALLFVVCMVLIAATALFATGCGNNASETAEPTTVTMENGAVLGEGAKQFTFTVVDGEGNETTATINSDADTVGEALQALKLIAGDPGDYGLYVKEVTGIRAVYEEDSTYWAFYINGEYGMTGVDKTDIEQGASYAFKVEK
jgi:uncharacterized lipoprotein NlpE involved in copper resistance